MLLFVPRVPRPPSLSALPLPLLSLRNGALLPAKPGTKEREDGKNETSARGPRRDHLHPMVSILFWVSSDSRRRQALVDL